MKRSLVLAQLLATAACTQTASTPAAGTLAGGDQSYIDKAVQPCDDFNAYANGAWAKTAVIPDDRTSIGVGFDVFKVAEQRNRELIEGMGKANAAAGTNARRIANYYAAFADTAGIDARGMAPLKGQLVVFTALKHK